MSLLLVSNVFAWLVSLQTRISCTFYRASSYASVIGSCRNSVCPSVCMSLCLSVCLSHACVATKQNNLLRIFWYHTKRQSLVFRHQHWLMGRPLRSEICTQSDPPTSKNAHFDRFPLIRSKTWDNEKSSTMTNRKSTTAFQRAIDGLRVLPLSPPKGGSKTIFLFFKNIIQFQSNKVGYKVSLCANSQRQSCSIRIHRSNGW